MGIPLEIAKTLVFRMQMLSSGCYISTPPLFILKDIFNDINDKTDFTATDVFNFLYQIKICGFHSKKYFLEQMKHFRVFSAFEVEESYDYFFLTPAAFSELPDNRGKYGCTSVIRIDFFHHRYSVRTEAKLKEVEMEKELYTLDSFGLSSQQVKLCQCAQEILATPTLKKRKKLVKIFHDFYMESPWVSQETFLPIKIARLIRHYIACCQIFLTRKHELMNAAQKLSDTRVKLYRENLKIKEINDELVAWKKKYHDKTLQATEAVISYLKDLGYECDETEWIY